jgi:hypothetical protein
VFEYTYQWLAKAIADRPSQSAEIQSVLMRSTSQSARLAISCHGDMVSSGGIRSLDGQPSCMRDNYWWMNALPSSPSMDLLRNPLRTQPSSTPTMSGPLALAGTNRPLQILFHWATPALSPQLAHLPVGR